VHRTFLSGFASRSVWSNGLSGRGSSAPGIFSRDRNAALAGAADLIFNHLGPGPRVRADLLGALPVFPGLTREWARSSTISGVRAPI
jgi:hypothetical protein